MKRFNIFLAACLLTAGVSDDGAEAATVVKVAHDQPETSPHHQAALKWKELLEAATDGRLTLEIFPASQLGSGTQMVEQVQAGAIEVGVLPTAWIAPLAPSVQVLDLPFLFPDRSTARAVVDGEAGDAILAPMRENGMTGFAFWESGFKQFTGNFEIAEPGDYVGAKIRTMPAPVIQEQFRAFGATPTTINFSELYSALQQKVVDGQENPISTIYNMKFFEVQDHLTLSDHGFLAYVAFANSAFLESLPEDDRAALVATAEEARDHQRALIEAAEVEHLKAFEAAGITITRLTPEHRSAFEAASAPVYAWYGERFGEETLELIRASISKLAADE